MTVEERVRGVLAALLAEDPGVPGATVAASPPGTAVPAVVAIGARGPADPTPRGPGDPFRLASATKAVTAATVLRLAARGVLALDLPVVRQCGPGLGAALRALSGHAGVITPRHLLAMRAGLGDLLGDPAFLARLQADPLRHWEPAELLAEAVARVGGRTAPPGAFAYADTGYTVLGLLVEERTAGSLAGAYRSEVLDPLGLRSTWLEHHEPAPPGLVRTGHSYHGTDLGGVDTSWDWAGGGLAATAEDLVRLGRALLAGPLLPPALRRELLDLRSDVVFPDPGQVGYDTYGLGVGGWDLPGHAVVGATGAWGAFVVHDRSTGWTLAGTADRAPVDRRRLVHRLLEALARPGG